MSAVPPNHADDRLPYNFAPAPRWIFEYVRECQIDERDGWRLCVLFHLAKTDALRKRAETPSVALDLLLEYLDPRTFRRETDRQRASGALRKWFQRAQARGLLEYRAAGNTRAGYRYVFRLRLEPPVVSVLCPSTNDGSCPTANDAVTDSAAATAENSRRSVSDRICSESDGSCPTGDGSCPSTNEPAKPHGDTDCAAAGDGSCPRASDGRENANPSPKERREEKPSRSFAHAREGGEPDALDRALAKLKASDDESDRTPLEHEQAVLDELVEQFEAEVRADSRGAPEGGT